MRRILVFDRTDYARANRRFALLQQAMLLAPPAAPEAAGQGRHAYQRSTDILRREAAVIDALDMVSEADPTITDNPPGVPGRRLRRDVRDLELTQPELALLRERVDPMRMPWVPAVARDVVALIDWLDAAPQVEETAPVSAS